MWRYISTAKKTKKPLADSIIGPMSSPVMSFYPNFNSTGVLSCGTGAKLKYKIVGCPHMNYAITAPMGTAATLFTAGRNGQWIFSLTNCIPHLSTA